MSNDTESIRILARKCAYGCLSLAQARQYFKSLYIGDAIARNRGNQAAAAKQLGVDTTYLSRWAHKRPHSYKNEGNDDGHE